MGIRIFLAVVGGGRTRRLVQMVLGVQGRHPDDFVAILAALLPGISFSNITAQNLTSEASSGAL